MNPRAPEVVASNEVGSFLPLSLQHPPPAIPPRGAGELVVPPDDQLRVVRAEAKAAGNLRDLRKMVAAWEAVAERCNLVFEEMVRLAVFRLEVERDLGGELAQTVRHGGDRSRSSRRILPREGRLPDGVSPNQSSQYQRLAAIPVELFQAYLEKARAAHEVPSSSGARRFACCSRPKPRGARASPPLAGTVTELPAKVLDALTRIMAPNVCVGTLDIRAERRVSPTVANIFDELRGDVLIGNCPDPERWLPTLRRLRNKAQVDQVVVLLAAEVWGEWFRLLREGEWCVCFLAGVRDTRGVDRLLAHQGARSTAFRVAFADIGTFL